MTTYRQETPQKKLHGNWCQKSKPQFDELLETQCGQVWEFKTSERSSVDRGGWGRRGSNCCKSPPGALPGPQGEDGRKIPSGFWQGEGKVTILKYDRNFCSSQQSLLSGETISPEPNLLGFYQGLIYLWKVNTDSCISTFSERGISAFSSFL